MPETATIAENPRRRSPKRDVRPAATIGDNGPTREDILFFAGLFAKDAAAIKAAQKARKATRQAAKLRGIQVEVLDEVMREAEKEDDTTFNRLGTFKQYAEFFGLPIGTQLRLFGEPGDGEAASRESLIQKAEREGYEDGLMGKNPDEQKYPPMTDEGQAYLRRWHAGQDVLKEKFLKLNEEKAAQEAAASAKKSRRKKADPENEADEADDGADGAEEPTKH